MNNIEYRWHMGLDLVRDACCVHTRFHRSHGRRSGQRKQHQGHQAEVCWLHRDAVFRADTRTQAE